MDGCPTYDHLSQGPTKTLQSLYWNKGAKAALCNEITQVFRKAPSGVDNTRHGQLVLRVSDSTELPPAERPFRTGSHGELSNYRDGG